MIPFAALQVVRKIVNHICAQYRSEHENHLEQKTKMASNDERMWKIASKVQGILHEAGIHEN